MKNAYNKSKDELMSMLTSSTSGLTSDEVNKRKATYGLNKLNEGAKKSIFSVFMEQFKDLLVIILIIAATISMFLGNPESAIVIFAVIVINAILGTVQHIKAEQSLNSLKALSAPMSKVLRNGEKVEIASEEVTVGDILYLEAGDFISADGRIIENYSLQVNESSLTGESLSVIKNDEIINENNVPVGDRKNMVFSGSLVTYGRATVLITSIGMETEIGNVAKLLESAKEKKTPLQVSLDDFGKKLAIIILIICGIIFALNMYRGYNLIDSFMFAVALAVAAIPEALSSIVTIVLALGTQKMSKENAIIRKLQAVESLGSVSIICSDKTGTLTQNKMTVKKLYVDNKLIEENNLKTDNTLENKLLLMSILCNDATSTAEAELGDPTEVALVNLGQKYGLNELFIRNEYKRFSEIPFDSDRKLMSTLHKINGQTLMFTKGALDVMLNRAVKIETSNGVRELTKEDKKAIEDVNRKLSQSGLRVLSFAYKEIDETKDLTLEDENNFIFVGLISMIDPPREESKKAVEDCIKAGIKPVMITGDHKITAAAIAREIGILKYESEAIEGSALDSMSDEELRNNVEKYSVYARVSPEHKIRIVNAWQEKGNVVAMTGDGVNDAPALKQADIGIAMGITGTEVAKDAASMILTDDNFATIVKSIANGRNIYSNIKNSIKFLLSGNTAGILSVLYASILALPVPFAPVHLLFMNLLTDSLPAIALGLEPHNKNVMSERPRNINSSILDKSFALGVLIEGVLIAIVTMIAFHIGLSNGDALLGSTMAFSTLCLARLVHGFTCRSKESVFKIGFFSNKYSWMAFLIGFILLTSVQLIEPLRGIFEVSKLSGNQFLTIYVLSLVPFIILQGYKLISNRNKVVKTVEVDNSSNKTAA
ncbi:cation-translocating P-type ATPase [Clostridium sp.]|uniref:cation-translocating P-type ATPase n=1 Tax=Clostridium sp. TaxID=1506 RepID=UPI0034648EEE